MYVNKKQYIRLILLGLFLQSVHLADADARDFHSPEERPTRGTSYTPAPKTKTLTAGLFGTRYSDLLATIGIAYAPVKFWDVGINLAHLGIGVLNVHTKFNLLDRKGWGIGTRVGFLWAHADWLWVLPSSQRNLVSGVDAFIIPVQLIGSVDVVKWLHFDLMVEYVDVEILGELSGQPLFYDGYLGARQVAIEPTVRFYLRDRFSLNISGNLPVWGQVRHEIVSDVTVSPGLRGGIRSAGYKTLKPLYKWFVTLSLQTELTRLLYLEVSLTVGPQTEKIYSKQVNAGVDLEWRF